MVFQFQYYELDSNENKNMKEKNDQENAMQNLIFNKIFKMLPQDIIINLDKNNYLKKLYDEKKIYYNLKSYIEKDGLLYKISIIYTFDRITDVINDIDNSSRSIMISEIKSEIQLVNLINVKIKPKLLSYRKDYYFFKVEYIKKKIQYLIIILLIYIFLIIIL